MLKETLINPLFAGTLREFVSEQDHHMWPIRKPIWHPRCCEHKTWARRPTNWLVRTQHNRCLPTAASSPPFITRYCARLDGSIRNRLTHTAKGTAQQSITFNLLRDMRQYSDAVLRFIHNPAVPFTNNVAERAVRMPKIKQKISSSFRTLGGAENFYVIRYASTPCASKAMACLTCYATRFTALLKSLCRAAEQ